MYVIVLKNLIFTTLQVKCDLGLYILEIIHVESIIFDFLTFAGTLHKCFVGSLACTVLIRAANFFKNICLITLRVFLHNTSLVGRSYDLQCLSGVNEGGEQVYPFIQLFNDLHILDQIGEIVHYQPFHILCLSFLRDVRENQGVVSRCECFVIHCYNNFISFTPPNEERYNEHYSIDQIQYDEYCQP